MKNTFLVVTSIASDEQEVLRLLANETTKRNIPFIVIGDTKSPDKFCLKGCEFYSISRQITLQFELAKLIPTKHYARKNLGYLIAISRGAEIIKETDDDNFPLDGFWISKKQQTIAHLILNKDWVNIYSYFSDIHIWPRGFSLEKIMSAKPDLESQLVVNSPIQQGLADENPDVDAIYRLTNSLPITFNKFNNIALGVNSFCPFNSQNTTWFKQAFPLLYLPSYCSFRMTDIWRSFIAQRIAWTCGWAILFHESTVWQERNEHNLMKDFEDEIIGYKSNDKIYEHLKKLELKEGIENIPNNMFRCYEELIRLELVEPEELILLKAWLNDINKYR